MACGIPLPEKQRHANVKGPFISQPSFIGKLQGDERQSQKTEWTAPEELTL